MPIRPDFQDVERELNRLLAYGREADRFNREDWPHLRNKEDFERIFEMGDEERVPYEELYCDGRDCAVWMANTLTGFNDVGQFPTLRSYVAAFPENCWVYQTAELKTRLAHIHELRRTRGTQPWSVREMTKLFQKQIEMLEATAVVLNLLKRTGLFMREGVENEPSPEAIAAGGGGQSFLENILAFALLLIVGLIGFSFLGAGAAILWLVFAIAVPPVAIAFARGAHKFTGNHLLKLYKSGINQIGVILRPLANLLKGSEKE